MMRAEFVRYAATKMMLASGDPDGRSRNAKSAVVSAQALADELGLTDTPPVAPVSDAALAAANARIAELEAQIGKLRADMGEAPTQASAPAPTQSTLSSKPPKGGR